MQFGKLQLNQPLLNNAAEAHGQFAEANADLLFSTVLRNTTPILKITHNTQHSKIY